MCEYLTMDPLMNLSSARCYSPSLLPACHKWPSAADGQETLVDATGAPSGSPLVPTPLCSLHFTLVRPRDRRQREAEGCSAKQQTTDRARSRPSSPRSSMRTCKTRGRARRRQDNSPGRGSAKRPVQETAVRREGRRWTPARARTGRGSTSSRKRARARRWRAP